MSTGLTSRLAPLGAVVGVCAVVAATHYTPPLPDTRAEAALRVPVAVPVPDLTMVCPASSDSVLPRSEQATPTPTPSAPAQPVEVPTTMGFTRVSVPGPTPAAAATRVLKPVAVAAGQSPTAESSAVPFVAGPEQGWQSDVVSAVQVRAATEHVPVSVVASAAGTTTPSMAGVSVWGTNSGLNQGLAASSCVPPQEDAWLVAGASTTGNTPVLVLANPYSTAVSATVEVHSAESSPAVVKTHSVAVPAYSSTQVLLGALAPAQSALAVRVVTAGGGLASYLVDSARAGTVSAGLDVVTPSTTVGERLVFTGVDLENKTSGTVRIVNTGDAEAVVSWTALRFRSDEVPLAVATTIKAGGVAQVPLPATYPKGVTGLVLSSDQPLAATVSLVKETKKAVTGQSTNPFDVLPAQAATTDHMWLNPAAALPTSAQNAQLVVFARVPDGVDVLDFAVDAGADAEPAQVFWQAVKSDGRLTVPASFEVKRGASQRLRMNDFGGVDTVAVRLWSGATPVYASGQLHVPFGWTGVTWYPPPVPPADVDVALLP